MEEIGESQLLSRKAGESVGVQGKRYTLTSPATYFCLLKILLYTSNLASSFLMCASKAVGSGVNP